MSVSAITLTWCIMKRTSNKTNSKSSKRPKKVESQGTIQRKKQKKTRKILLLPWKRCKLRWMVSGACVKNRGRLQRHGQFNWLHNKVQWASYLISDLQSRVFLQIRQLELQNYFTNWTASNSNLKVRIVFDCLCDCIVLGAEILSSEIVADLVLDKRCCFLVLAIASISQVMIHTNISWSENTEWFLIIFTVLSECTVPWPRVKFSLLWIWAQRWRKVSVVSKRGEGARYAFRMRR